MMGRHTENQTETTFGTVIMDCGSGNFRRYIYVTEIKARMDALHEGLAGAMPGFHAFTGCDVISAFYRKGKIKPFEILQRDEGGEFVRFFGKLSSINEDPDTETAERFTSLLYGVNTTDINEARLVKLQQLTGKMNQVSF